VLKVLDITVQSWSPHHPGFVLPYLNCQHYTDMSHNSLGESEEETWRAWWHKSHLKWKYGHTLILFENCIISKGLWSQCSLAMLWHFPVGLSKVNAYSNHTLFMKWKISCTWMPTSH